MGKSEEERKPLKLAYWIATHPFIQLFLVIGFALVLAAILIGLGMFGFSDQTEFDYMIKGHVDTNRDNAVRAALEMAGENDQGENTLEPVQETRNSDWDCLYIYKSKEDNVFTPENLRHIQEREESLMNDEEYQEFCVFTPGTENCDDLAFGGVARYTFLPFFKSQVTGEYDFSEENIQAVLTYLASDAMIGYSTFFFDSEFSSTNLKSKYARSSYFFGTPLGDDGTGDQFTTSSDRASKQESKFKNFILNHRVQPNGDELEVVLYGRVLQSEEFTRITNHDLTFAVGSVCFVWAFMWFHTTSFWLACMGMLQIILSFPITYFFYYLICQIQLFQSIHVLSVFIILGIGADNVFVFQDAWVQADVELAFTSIPTDLPRRLSWVYRRAAKTMFSTTLTTAVAFL